MGIQSLGQSSQLNPPNLPPPGNLGNRLVKDITGQATGMWGNLKDTYNEMGEAERGYYFLAAIIALFVLAIFTALIMTGGIATVGIAACFPLVALAGVCIYAGRTKTWQRKEWALPRFSPNVKGRPAAESEWKRLWDARNQAKLAHKNVADVVNQERLMRDITKDEEYADFLLKAYEKAEVDFWQFADEDIADEKIDEFNEARTRRGDPDLF